MNMKFRNPYMLMACCVLALLVSCSKNWLKPQPESFFTPENTFVDKAGFDGLLLSCRKQLRHEFYDDHCGMTNEYYFSDIGVNGCPDPTDPHDLSKITPTNLLNTRISWYWTTAWNGIKYANIGISRIDNAKWNSEADKNAILGECYFHRAYWYYRLINQFGDVPYLDHEYTEPVFNFVTMSREGILKRIKTDMEYAVKWMPTTVQPGMVNKAAAYQLLTKLYLQLGEYRNAETAASYIINNSGLSLMKNRFGKYAADPKYDIMWDLHQKENKSIGENTEAILVVQDKFNMDGNATGSTQGGTQRMRDCTPAWWWTPVIAPDGKRGTTDAAKGKPLLDSLGRGIARLRTANWFNYDIWADATDLRHSNVNWWSKDEFYYNDPSSRYYRQPIVQGIQSDTIRTLFPFPYNKIYVFDEEKQGPTATDIRGGHSDWYIYRLAETYLLRAEAYYWQNNMAAAANDINEVRTRAHARPITANMVTIEYIFEERARELYFEEPRHCELARVSYIMAKAGINGYSLQNMVSKNWFYDQVIKHNNFYRENIDYAAGGKYMMLPYHIYWPIPQGSIDANTDGHINQAPGYPGSEKNIAPLE